MEDYLILGNICKHKSHACATNGNHETRHECSISYKYAISEHQRNSYINGKDANNIFPFISLVH